MAIDRTVPSERNNTYVPSEVSRRTAEELFEIAFNEDQKKALLSLLSGDSEDTPAIPAPTTADNGKVLGVSNGEYVLADASSEGALIFTIQEEEVPSGTECPNGGIKLTYNHSWQEIYDALAQGKSVVQIVDMGEPEIDSYNVTQNRVTHASGGASNEYTVVVESYDDPLPFPNATDKVMVVCNE